MGWLWKLNKTADKQRAEAQIGEPFLLDPRKGLNTVNLEIVLTEPPKISYEMWAHKYTSSSDKRVTGSFVIDMWGKVKRAYQAQVLQGKSCNILINQHGGSDADTRHQRGDLGYVRLLEDESCFDIVLDSKDQFISDLGAFIGLYQPTATSLFRLRIDIENERRSVAPTSSELRRIIFFDIVRVFVWYDLENREIEPWEPP